MFDLYKRLSQVWLEAEGGGNGGGGSSDGGSGTGSQSSGAGSGSGSGSTGTGSQGTGSGSRDEVYTREYVEDLRKEAAGHRVRANDSEKRVNELTGKVNELTSKLTDGNYKAAAMRAVEEAGAIRADVVAGLLKRDALDCDSDGKPSAEKLKAAVVALTKEFPELFRKGGDGRKIDADAGGKAAGSTVNDMIRRAAGR